MKKIFTLFSLLMLTVVAMAADLTTGVTFKGTWADTDGGYTPTEGEIKVTKTDDGLKFEVKNHVFNGYAFPDYTVDYKIDVTEDGSFNDESGFAHAVLGGNASTEGKAIMNAYWQMIKGSVNNKSIDLYIKYLGANMDELIHVTFKGTAVETTGINTVNTADNSTITEIYTLGGARVNSLQKGINIVRLANGKTVKVIK
uniref:hypothetical protein n=1 Tax=Prevotella sp. TaxID=59823 RepID=UPI0040289FED